MKDNNHFNNTLFRHIRCRSVFLWPWQNHSPNIHFRIGLKGTFQKMYTFTPSYLWFLRYSFPNENILKNDWFHDYSHPRPILNPIWTGLFANLKRLGGQPPPNFAISGQKTMKLAKGILWVEIFTIWEKFRWRHRHVNFMTSSKWDNWNNSRFPRVLAEYLKNGPTDFHQTYVIFRSLYIEGFEIKRLKIDHSLLPW